MQKHKWTPRIGALAVAFALVHTATASAQQPAPPVERSAASVGRIVGRVLDAQTGEGLSSVTIQVVGTSIGTISGVSGRFVLPNVPTGKATLQVQSLGYATKTVTDVDIIGGGIVEQNISLQTEAIAIGAVEVTAAAERGSVNRALDQQRTATNIVNAVTSEQISRSPDSDAAQAVQRVSGVTVQDNKFVIVRGLGERYTTTSLNGSRIPSPEPEKKLVPLDLFPSALLETITTSKTFTPDQPGDFSGAQVDIKMRDFPTQQTRTFSSSFGWNGQASGRDVFSAPGAGGEWLGFTGSARAVPSNVAAAGRFGGSITPQQMNEFVGAFRNTWSATSGTGTPTGSANFSIGGNDPIFGRQIGYVLSGTYSYGQEIRSNEVRATAQPTGTGGTVEVDRYTGATGRTSVLWGGVLNASTLLGSNTRLALNTTYNRSSDNEARQEIGTSEQYGLPLEVTRLRYIERGVASAQLIGEHELGARHRIDWAVTGSQVTRSEPDRSEFVYSRPTDQATGQIQPREWFSSSAEGAVRTFGDLTERAVDVKTDYRMGLGAARNSYLKVGGLFRAAHRDSDAFVYSIIAPTLPVSDRRLSPEQIFDGRFSQPGQSFFQVAPLAQGGSYTADDKLFAGYAMADFGLTDRIRVVTGARVEHSDVKVSAEPTLGAPVVSTPSFTDVLPSLALNIALTDKQNVRLSASQTLSRPEYRELAEVMYREVIGAETVLGNPNLVRTLVRNVDARWELYPSSGEVLSLALFAKDFKNPIERVYLGTSGTGKVATFTNAKGAVNYGVEVEARKRLGFVSESLENLTAFVNATVMKSEIEIGEASGASKTNDKRPMVGQSPYVFNAGMTYASNAGLSVTALYNLFGKRIASAAVVPLPDVYEQPRNQLDLAFRFPVMSRLAVKLDAKNVLDDPYELTQGTVLREYYKSGRIFTVGMTWRP